jgi:hypothetical protein
LAALIFRTVFFVGVGVGVGVGFETSIEACSFAKSIIFNGHTTQAPHDVCGAQSTAASSMKLHSPSSSSTTWTFLPFFNSGKVVQQASARWPGLLHVGHHFWGEDDVEALPPLPCLPPFPPFPALATLTSFSALSPFRTLGWGGAIPGNVAHAPTIVACTIEGINIRVFVLL